MVYNIIPKRKKTVTQKNTIIVVLSGTGAAYTIRVGSGVPVPRVKPHRTLDLRVVVVMTKDHRSATLSENTHP